MAGTPKSFDRLAAELQRLPGHRRQERGEAGVPSAAVAGAKRPSASPASITEARAAVRRCSVCNTLTEPDPCDVCSDPERDGAVLCVVEEPGNVAAIEKTREYRAATTCCGERCRP